MRAAQYNGAASLCKGGQSFEKCCIVLLTLPDSYQPLKADKRLADTSRTALIDIVTLSY